MATLDDLFQQLHNRSEISTLIGQTEAFSGFANADGGVVLVGTEARPARKFYPDVIMAERPVAGALAVKARIKLWWENWSNRRCRV